MRYIKYSSCGYCANGNLSTIWECPPDKYARFHDWDEENRLRMVVGNDYAGYYGYDANGERVYKITGLSSIQDEGFSLHTRASVQIRDAALYPNPYIVITPRGYTKHYYAGAERLATVIGG